MNMKNTKQTNPAPQEVPDLARFLPDERPEPPLGGGNIKPGPVKIRPILFRKRAPRRRVNDN